MDKKNFLFVSLTGLISDIAWQVSKEGHEVRYFIGDKKERDIADGFVAKSKDWGKDKEWADIIVFDDTLGQGEKAQALRKEGKPVIGGTALRQTRRRPLVRPGRAEESRRQYHSLRRVRIVRRRGRPRDAESRALRHQAQRRSAECETTSLRRRGRRRARCNPHARSLQAGIFR